MLIKNKVGKTRNNRINCKLLIQSNLRQNECSVQCVQSEVTDSCARKQNAELMLNIIKSLSVGIQARFLQVSNGVT